MDAAHEAFADDVPAIAIAALAPIPMPDHERLRAVACLSIVLTAEEEDARAAGLDDAGVKHRLQIMAVEHAARVWAMQARG